MKELPIVVISLLKAFMQTTFIPVSHSDTLVCSSLCASYCTVHYLHKHRSMLADMSMFVAMLCVCFATLCDASRLAAACSHNVVGHTEACRDAHSFSFVSWCLEHC
jgi:hypothetical protein